MCFNDWFGLHSTGQEREENDEGYSFGNIWLILLILFLLLIIIGLLFWGK